MRCIEPYLQKFALGLDSHPEALCKTSVIRSCLAGIEVAALKEKLPDALVDFLDNLPPNSVWVSEIKSQVIFLGMIEVLGEEAFLAHVDRSNRRLFSSPLYRSLFAVFSAERSLKLVASAWARFHKGSELSMIATRQKHITLKIQAPKYLFVPTMMRAFSQSCASAIETGGAKNTRLTPGELSDSSYTFDLRWD